MPERPNILLITTDTQRWDTLRCMGSAFAKSPSLDRMAREGVMFTQGHTASPVCSPARCSLLTGLHPPVHGVIENGVQPRQDLAVFPDALQAAGYSCIMSGKTHFGPTPSSFRFDYTLSGGRQLYETVLAERGFEVPTTYPHPVPEDLFLDAFITTKTMQGIDEARSQRRGAPFFAFCSLFSPHAPLHPPGDWGERYRLDELPPSPLNPDTVGEPEHTRKLLGLGEEAPTSRHDIDRLRQLYYGLSAYCDHQVGRLLDYLNEEGLSESTLVLFTSDHGTDLYDHGFDNKHVFYDNTWRVPFLMRMPGTIEAGSRRRFAHWNDLPATILGAAGLPWDDMQGFDLFTPVAAGEASPRRCAVSALYRSCALATERWKVEYYFEDGTCRLFDRASDPGEYADLSQSRSHLALRQALVEALLNWRGDLLDTGYLKGRTAGTAPVASRVTRFVAGMRGNEADARLNERAEEIDRLFGTL